MQATFLTGLPPSGHGIVGNGWFFRDLGEVWLWRQGHGLVGGETVWQAARGRDPGLRVANVCWWYAMVALTDYTVTPRPVNRTLPRRRFRAAEASTSERISVAEERVSKIPSAAPVAVSAPPRR
jgi:predicted AlkP superfamily pyrophosphatase or phosphodiesterase